MAISARPSTMAPLYSASLTGGYVAAGAALRDVGSGSIAISGIPAGSTITKAYLLWNILDIGVQASDGVGTVNGTLISGTFQSSDTSPCWGVPYNLTYAADVTQLVTGNGTYALTGFPSGLTGEQDPWSSPDVAPEAEGATLFVAYSNPQSPPATVQLYAGASAASGWSLSQTFSGFNVPATPSVTTTFIVADGQDSPDGASPTFDGGDVNAEFDGEDPLAGGITYSQGNLWDTRTVDVSADATAGDTSATATISGLGDCLVWVGQALSVSAGTPTAYQGPLPLLMAHGITGTADGEKPMEQDALDTVPGLQLPNRTLRVDTGKVSSIWDNGHEIADDAQAVIASTGAPAVNVLAHSKGGLDTREAIWEAPGLFSQLGMLSTPNGGSSGADKLCKIRRIWFGGDVQSQFGACNDDSDGLYDLQTGYVKNVFDDIVRDDPSVTYYDVGSNCSTGNTTYKCNFADNLLVSCRDGGDTAVCLESAYWLTYNYPGVAGGLQIALPPFSGYSHSDMNKNPCPVTFMLSYLYPEDSVGNPWLGGNGTGCSQIGAAPPVTTTFIAPAARQLTTSASAAASPSTPATSQATGSWADQSTAGGPADPTHPFVLTLNPEGADGLTAQVLLPLGVVPTVTVTDKAGHPDTSADIHVSGDDDGIGAQTVTVSLTNLKGASRVLTVAVDGPTSVGVSTAVPSSTILTATASPAGPTTATVTATLAALSAASSSQVTVLAAYTGPDGKRVTGTLSYNKVSRSFTGSLSVPTGSYTPIDISAQGPGLTRFATTGVVLPTNDAQIGQAHDDAVVDTNHDGMPDTLAIPIRVTTTLPGTYHLAVDLDSAGHAVVSGGSDLTVATPGTSDMTVQVPLSRLLAGDAPSGAFEVVRGTLTRGVSGRSLVARSADMGSTASYNLDSYAPATIELSRFAATSADTDGDDILDSLRAVGAATVPTTGSYELTAALHAPDGHVLTQVDQTQTLTPGRHPLSVSIDGSLIGSTGSGTYSLTDIRLTKVGTQLSATTSPVVIGPLDATQWLGAKPSTTELRRMWDDANAAKAIHAPFLYLANAIVLIAADRAASTGDVTTEKRALDAFIFTVGYGGAPIDAPWKARLLKYAGAVRAPLGT